MDASDYSTSGGEEGEDDDDDDDVSEEEEEEDDGRIWPWSDLQLSVVTVRAIWTWNRTVCHVTLTSATNVRRESSTGKGVQNVYGILHTDGNKSEATIKPYCGNMHTHCMINRIWGLKQHTLQASGRTT